MIEDHRKSVLLITRNFPPMVGGMEKLNQKMLQDLAERRPTFLIGPKGARQFAPESTRVYESPADNLFIFLLYAKCMAFFLAFSKRFDVCLAGSGLTAPYAWLAARISRARAIVYVHGLDLIADNRLYQWLWLPFIRRCDTVIANSANTRQLAESVGVLPERITVVHPGTDIPEMDSAKASEFRSRFGFGNLPLLLSVGRITERKGLLPFLRNAWPKVLDTHPDAQLVVIGTEPNQALRKDRRSALADIRAYLSESGLEHSVRFLGRVDDVTLTAAFQAVNVHVFPVLDGPDDVEGFGMVAIEAAAHGLKTVAFRAGGVSDAVAEGESGCLLAPGDYEAMARTVVDELTAGKSPDDMWQCRNFAERFTWHAFNAGIQQALTP